MTARGPCMPALLLILIHVMPVAESSEMITGFVGYNVTLPCSYDAQYYGGLHVCWGRGEIPRSGCDNEIIATDGFKVTRRKSHRYQLSGDLNQGDVSLTIIDAEMGDSGIYGCRVEIPGWFNDLKIQVTLTIQNIRKTTASPTDAASPATQTAISLTRGYYGNYSTGSSAANTPQGSAHTDRSFLIIVPVAVILLLLLLLVLVTGLWLHKRKQQREARTLAAVEHQADASVHYGNVGAHIGFHTRGMATENIYDQRDFGDYESCP
ncbi:T-cell immunoglobulin and mucin domain-containing protein 4-like [Brienomyrus brachyistius]|uniref:T-cell immunoglobulin and mucin domain-containing protein 4-like n=1 Tax=Brienomyrus brachyistius TaxID=42636 RepID=UPI0020B19A6A|nr:T-cell immunoglobulin and mucin domain-containing protein 4-like [Brienomyrus brachyistius]